MSIQPDPAPGQRRKLRWKRWAAVDLVIALIMTYVEVAILGVIGKIINAVFDTNAGDQPVLAVLFGIFAFVVNFLVAVIFTIVIGIFVSLIKGPKPTLVDEDVADAEAGIKPHRDAEQL